MTGRAAPLGGVTIVELGGVIAGNFGQVILGDLGAEIIKVEPPTGDTARNASIAPYADQSTVHLFMNRGKKSVVINLKTEPGREVFHRLIAEADVVVDNFRPGVLQRLGLDHEALTAINPRIVTVSITGFGETGPLRDKPAFDLVVQAYSGHMSITGEPDGPPNRAGVPLADLSGGVYGALSILTALLDRDRNGVGRHVEVSMLESMVHLLAYDGLDYLTAGRSPQRHGSAHAHIVPWRAFATSDDQHLVVAARDEKFWLALGQAIDRPDLADDDRAADNAARVANRDWLEPELEAAFSTRPRAEWLEILERHDIPSAPVNTLDTLFTDPHLEARGMIQTGDHPTVGPVRYQPTPIKVDGWQPPATAAPALGQHTKEILTRLGYDEGDLAELLAAGAVVSA